MSSFQKCKLLVFMGTSEYPPHSGAFICKLYHYNGKINPFGANLISPLTQRYLLVTTTNTKKKFKNWLFISRLYSHTLAFSQLLSS